MSEKTPDPFFSPQLTSVLTPAAAGELPPYPNYRRALWDMVSTLGDPRVGAQWVRDRQQAD